MGFPGSTIPEISLLKQFTSSIEREPYDIGKIGRMIWELFMRSKSVTLRSLRGYGGERPKQQSILESWKFLQLETWKKQKKKWSFKSKTDW